MVGKTREMQAKGFLKWQDWACIAAKSQQRCDTIRVSLLHSVAHEKDGFEEGFGMGRPG